MVKETQNKEGNKPKRGRPRKVNTAYPIKQIEKIKPKKESKKTDRKTIWQVTRIHKDMDWHFTIPAGYSSLDRALKSVHPVKIVKNWTLEYDSFFKEQVWALESDRMRYLIKEITVDKDFDYDDLS